VSRTDGIVPFLTAWDPSDLPGRSVDPLGFDSGYGCLADKILPGLTNVARQPRYFSLICAGASLGPSNISPNRSEVQERQDFILRLERYWALANVLVAEAGGPGASGIRGVSYAEARLEELRLKGRRSTGSHFLLLSRQLQYGAVGIYGPGAHGMRLLDRKTLSLLPDSGETLGLAFVSETRAPKSLLTAVRDPEGEVGLDVLRAWGLQAHLAGDTGPGEALILGEALHRDPVRSRMATAIARRRQKEGETELQRLRRIAENLAREDKDLSEAIDAILIYEDCYAWILLSFERVLWRCSAAGAIGLSKLSSDEVIQRCARTLPGLVSRFEKTVESAETAGFKRELERLRDVRAFFVELAKATLTSDELVDQVLRRHTEVQHGKFDQGRRKLPWVEAVDGNAVLTLARAPQVGREPYRAGDVLPHEYRTMSADALLLASRGTRP